MPQTSNDELLGSIRTRQEKKTEFNYGISTGDAYAKNLQQCVGSDLCNRYASVKNVSFHDAVKRASGVLTYSNPEMEVQDKYGECKNRTLHNSMGDTSIELPKNTLMVFRNRLTTPRKDRDGDILRTQGARPDPKMLLLWQHVHTLPIGKALGVAEHTSKYLDMYTAIIDLNELSHDAAVMVDNDMLRFSQGFKALEFEAIKQDEGKTTKPGGFDIKSFEIMEESGVSVPANPDSEVVEVYLDLIESDKLSSSMMKSFGKKLRADRKSTVSAGGLDLNITLNVKETEDETKSSSTKCPLGKTPGTCPCASEKTDDDADKGVGDGHGEEDDAKESEMICPKCKGKVVDGVCTKCGEKMPKEKPQGNDDGKDDKKEDKSFDGEKAGRVLSKSNYNKLLDVTKDMEELHKDHVSTRSGKALCDKCFKTVQSVVKSAGYEDDGKGTEVEISEPELIAKAAETFLTKADAADLDQMLTVLEAMKNIRDMKKTTALYKKAVTSIIE